MTMTDDRTNGDKINLLHPYFYVARMFGESQQLLQRNDPMANTMN